jgi:AraC-like DNA-binding protein
LDADLEALMRRDVKGLYHKAVSGVLTGLTGVSDPYEPPRAPRLRLKTDQEPLDACVDAIVEVLRTDGLLPSACVRSIRRNRRPAARRKSRLLCRIQSMLSDNGLCLQAVAEAEGLSTGRVSKALKCEVGMSFMSYVRAERVRQAALLLRTSDRSVKEVAFAVGYGSTHRLDRNFYRVFGLSPQAYRLTCRAESGLVGLQACDESSVPNCG